MKYPTGFTFRVIDSFRPGIWKRLMLPGVLAVAASPLTSQFPSASPVSGLINPQAIVFSPSTGKVYSVETDRGLIDVSDDTNGTVNQVKVGAGPVSIAADAATGRVYVANSEDGTVSVIDGRSDGVIATVPVGSHPYSIAANSKTSQIYVSRTYSDELTVIDGSTNGLTRIKTGSADLIAVDVRRNRVFAADYEGGVLTTVNGATRAVTTRPAGMHLWGMALNESTGALYIARPGTADIIVLHSEPATSEIIHVGGIPCAIAINTHTNEIYVANYEDASASVVDGITGRNITKIPAGPLPQAIAVDSVRNLVFVANTHTNQITVVDGATHRVLDTVPAGQKPYAIALNPYSQKLHVANLGAQPFTLIDLKRFAPHNP